MLVPETADEIMFFNTRNAAGQLQDSTTQFVRLVEHIKNMPYFAQSKDASEPGIYLYSELIYYSCKKSDKKFDVLLFKLNDGDKFRNFITAKTDRKYMGLPIKTESIYFSELPGKNAWLVWNKNIAALVGTTADEELRIPFFQNLFAVNDKTPPQAANYIKDEKKLHGWYINKTGVDDSGEVSFKNYSFYFNNNNLVFEGELLKPIPDILRNFTCVTGNSKYINASHHQPDLAAALISPGIRVSEGFPVYSNAHLSTKNNKVTAQISATNTKFSGFDVFLGLINHNISISY